MEPLEDGECRVCWRGRYQARNHVQMAWNCPEHGVVTYDPQEEIKALRQAAAEYIDAVTVYALDQGGVLANPPTNTVMPLMRAEGRLAALIGRRHSFAPKPEVA